MSETLDYDKSAIPKAHGPTHEKNGGDEVNADAQLGAYTDARARAAIDDIFGADGKADKPIDMDVNELRFMGNIYIAGNRGLYCEYNNWHVTLWGSKAETNAANMRCYGRDHGTYPGQIQFRIGTTIKAYFDNAGKFSLTEDLLASGNVGIKTPTPTAALDINSDILRLRTAKTPASAGATGNAGDICWDAEYIYVCVDTDTWKRTAITTW